MIWKMVLTEETLILGVLLMGFLLGLLCGWTARGEFR